MYSIIPTADGLLCGQTIPAGSTSNVCSKKSRECRIDLRRATRPDIARMARETRQATPHQAEAAGLNPKRELWKSFHASLECWAVEVEGEGLAAVFGLGGCFLSDVGEPWMYTTALVEKYPFAFVRVSHEIIDTMLEITPKLEGFIFADYAQGIRFLRGLGFSFGETVKMGPLGAPFVKFSRVR